MNSARTIVSRTILWGFVVAYVVILGVNSLRQGAIPVAAQVLVLLAFVLVHGALRYGVGGILIFLGITLLVSNILENTSILTGFPFGHYHYTDALGPKLFLVPLLIGPAYVGTGYLAWILANALVGEVRRASPLFLTIAVPIIASFLMVVWDLCLDPSASTIGHLWIWEQGGGFFGVPLSNYLGWFLTVYLFYQLFAVYLRVRPAARGERLSPALESYVQAVVLYAVIGLGFVLQEVSAGPTTAVTDAAGTVWQTGAIHETAAIVSLFTMLFIAVLTIIRLLSPWTAPKR
jgi:uncharacterized membrane protein